MKKFIEYFSDKHIFTNFIVIAVFVGAVIFWNKTGKEEMPNITLDFVSVSVSYPGATADEVEYFVTKELEDALTGIDGIEEIESTSSQGSCRLRINLTPNNKNRKNVVDDIKDAVSNVKLPDEIEDDPNVWEFKSTKMPIIDLMMVYDDVDIMNHEQRTILQSYVDTLEDKILRQPFVSEVNISGYLENYIEIQLIPEKLAYYNISISQIISAIKKNNLKQPLGTMDDKNATKIKLDAELNEIDTIKNIIVQSSFEGYNIRLKDLANVVQTFEKPESYLKINGSEAIRINVVKTSDIGIIQAIDRLKIITDEFSKTALKESPVKLIPMDDESVDIRNRLFLITMNGLVGFIFIIIVLFFFLNAKSALWVAMGIPFTFGFTMILASLLGHTINNITLAAIIIVMGMVVDDAIVVAENVSRLMSEGVKPKEAVIRGTAFVLLPITASIVTTCVAFVPLFFWEGRFGLMVKYIPPIIFLMLGGSLFEAIFILPSHLRYNFPRWVRVIFTLGLLPVIEKHYNINNKKTQSKNDDNQMPDKVHWFMKVEDFYGEILKKLLKFKWIIFIIAFLIILYSIFIFIFKMKYTMFPREETTQISITGEAPFGTLKEDVEKLIRPVEDIFLPYLNKEVIGFRVGIGQSRWGGRTRENVFNMRIEILPKDKRKKSANQLIEEWQKEIDKIKGFTSLKIIKSRFGHSSGSAIDILVKENDDETRFKIADEIKDYLIRYPAIINSEVESQFNDPEYSIKPDRDLINRLNISTDTIATSLRTVLEGNNVYDISKAGKDLEVIVTVPPKIKSNIDAILNMPIENQANYLVPLNKIVKVTKHISPNTITRLDGKRTIHVYADMKDLKSKTKQPENNNQNNQDEKNNWKNKNENDKKPEKIDKLKLSEKMTILEIAKHLEENLFPEIYKKYPTAQLEFYGEIKESRESTYDFLIAFLLAAVLIYVILALTLNSLTKPIIIILSIPFGLAGIIITLQLHGMLIFGFFSIIGALGLTGVVVNDSIVLLVKLEDEYSKRIKNNKPNIIVADITKTRLRAVLLTTLTTVAGLLPTAYGVCGYDSMLAEMMLTLAWGLIFGTIVTLILVPSIYCSIKELRMKLRSLFKADS